MTRLEWDGFDPRAKTAAVLFGVAALLVAPPMGAAAALAPLLVMTALSTDGRRFRGVVRAALILATFTVAVNALLVPGPRWGPEGMGWLRPSAEGIRAGLIQAARVAGIAALGGWLAAQVRAFDLLASLEWSVRRRGEWRRRVHAAGLPLLLAMRLVPILGEEAARLIEIERLRFGPLPRRRILRRAAALAPLWILCALDRASDLALALTLRGHRVDGPRGFARPWPWRGRDGLLTATGVVFLVVAAWR